MVWTKVSGHVVAIWLTRTLDPIITYFFVCKRDAVGMSLFKSADLIEAVNKGLKFVAP